jgi:hypothetical protein
VSVEFLGGLFGMEDDDTHEKILERYLVIGNWAYWEAWCLEFGIWRYKGNNRRISFGTWVCGWGKPRTGLTNTLHSVPTSPLLLMDL